MFVVQLPGGDLSSLQVDGCFKGELHVGIPTLDAEIMTSSLKDFQVDWQMVLDTARQVVSTTSVVCGRV